MAQFFREAHMPLPSSIGWDWGMSANGWRIPQPQMGFYWNLPADAPCAFSKKREQRSISRGLAPKHRAIAWNDARVHAAAAALRAEHSDTVKTLVRPKRWEDIYQFFDTVDLWFEGSWNLWRVLHLLCDENDVAAQRVSLDSAILDEVESWAYKWCTHKTNRLKLATWDQKSDILSVLSESDSRNVAGCRKEALDMLRDALKYWHGQYKIPVPEQDGSKADAQQLDRLPENSPTAPKPIENDVSPHVSVSRPSTPAEVPQGRARRRSSSVPPKVSTDLLPPPYIYTKNPNVVIVNGTTPIKSQQISAGDGCSNGTAGESFRRGHQPSKSGPVPAVFAGHFLTARGAGVENSGPSRLPKGPQQLSEIRENPPQASQVEKKPQVNSQFPATQSNIAPYSSNGNSSIDNTAGSRTRPHVSRCQNSGIGVASYASSFAVCPCPRCMEASRSVHVGFIRVERSISNDKMCGILTEYFGRWGHVEGCEIRKSNAAVFCFAFVRYTSEQGAQQAVAAANGQPINAPGLVGAKVTHPFYSRYYKRLPRFRRESSVSHHSSSGSSPPGDSSSSSSWGNIGGRHWGHQQSRPRFTTPPRSQYPTSRSTRWSPNGAFAARTNSHQIWNRQVSGNSPTGPATARSGSMFHPHQPAHRSGYPMHEYSGTPPQGPWIGQHPQGSPPFAPLPMPLVAPPQVNMGPYPQYGWPEVPMPPGPPIFYPFPPPVPMYHSGGPVQAAGQYGFPPPPPQAEPQIPTAHGPESQNHAHSGQASLPLAHNSPAPDPQTEPSNNCSVQTKPPSAEEAFPGKPSAPRSPAASIHSSTEDVSIRVRLPVQPAGTEPEKSPVRTPSRNKLRRDSPVRQLTFGDIPPPAIAVDTEPEQCPVLIEDHNKIRADSPVRRITFGDFAPPEEQTGPATEHAEPTSPTPENVTNGSSQANQEPAPSTKKEGDNTQEVFEWQFNPSSSHRNSGDIRLEPDYTGTVIHRKPRRQRVPWEEDCENGSYGFWNHYHGSYPAHPSPHGANGMLHPPPLPHPYPHPMSQKMSRSSNGHFPQQGFHGPQQNHFNDSPPKQWNGHHSPPAPGVQAPESGSPPRPDEPGPTKPQKKKKFNKHKNKSGPNSRTQSRSTTPLPQATGGNATPKDNGPAAPGAANLNGSANTNAKGKGKGSRKAATRSTTPVPPEPTAQKHSDNGNGNGGGEDIYNATPPPPKKGKGTGCVPDPGTNQVQAQKIPNDDEAGDHKAVKKADPVGKKKADKTEPNGVVVVEEGDGGDTNKGANDKKDEEQGGDFRAGAGGSLRVPRNRKWNKNAAKRMDVREFFKEEN